MKNHETRSLRELLANWSAAVAGTSLPKPPAFEGPDVSLSTIVEHSNLVEPGACFVARVRTGTDGHPYISHAIERGAVLILGQRAPADLGFDLGQVVYLQVQDTAVAEAWLAAAWHGFPSHNLVVIGVTGTDGKTTTANLIHQILTAAGLRAGLLSTLRAIIGDQEETLALHVTTPEAPIIQRYLRRMVDAGLSHCVLEATSHGLAQDRVGAVAFDLAVVTNITHEHLDYHGDYDGYFTAKARLFMGLDSEVRATLQNPLKSAVTPTAILNIDDASFPRLAALTSVRQITYGLVQSADVQATSIQPGKSSTEFDLHLPETDSFGITAPLVGNFNVYNMLAAAAAAHSLGINPAAIRAGLSGIDQLAGRMHRVDRGQPFTILVDFAHTPNALAQAISAARGMTGGQVIVVFGSAGKRDVAKRHLMAEIAARQADLTVLTAEDPRTESLAAILADMATGCQKQGGQEGKTFWRVPDRGRAIYFALAQAQPGDLVLICGKGHEQSMCFGTIEYPWDDLAAAEAALEAFLAGQPAPDLGLPTFDN